MTNLSSTRDFVDWSRWGIWYVSSVGGVVYNDWTVWFGKIDQLLHLLPGCCITSWVVWRAEEYDVRSWSSSQVRKEVILWAAVHVHDVPILAGFFLELSCSSQNDTGIYKCLCKFICTWIRSMIECVKLMGVFFRLIALLEMKGLAQPLSHLIPEASAKYIYTWHRKSFTCLQVIYA